MGNSGYQTAFVNWKHNFESDEKKQILKLVSMNNL